jgi:anti-anti-sigma regulatory factor
MPVNTVLLSIDGACLAENLREAAEKVDGAEREVVIDFSSVCRIDAGDLQAMETLAGAAESKAVKVVLCGVNSGIYKTLKLAKLAPRFSFMV